MENIETLWNKYSFYSTIGKESLMSKTDFAKAMLEFYNSLPVEAGVIKKNGGQEVCEQLIEILDKHIDLADASKMDGYRPYNDGAHTAYLVVKKLVETKLRAIKGC